MSHNVRELVTDYLEYVEVERGRSAKTVENYHRYLLRFVAEAHIVKPTDITLECVRRYRVGLNRAGLKRVTQNYYVVALRGFLKYLAKRSIPSLAPEQIELGKQEDRQVAFLEGDEVRRLLVAPQGSALDALRDRAILETLFSTGLRVSELVGLNRDQVNLAKGEFSVRGKGGKVRVVFLSVAAREAINTYVGARTDVDAALFIRVGRLKKTGGEPKTQQASDDLRLTTRSVERLVRKYAIAAGISEKVVPHTMRHSYATDLLRNGADIRSVQALLGHASITTTQVYTHVTDKQLRDIYERYHDAKKKGA